MFKNSLTWCQFADSHFNSRLNIIRILRGIICFESHVTNDIPIMNRVGNRQSCNVHRKLKRCGNPFAQQDRNPKNSNVKKIQEILEQGVYKDRYGFKVDFSHHLMECVDNTELIQIPPPTHIEKNELNIKVLTCKTISAALDLRSRYDIVTVVNFASGLPPKDMMNRNSQESCLLRQTALSASLNSKVCDHFFQKNKDQTIPLKNNGIIYSPGVPVLQDDHGELLSKNDYCTVDIISACPVNRKRICDSNSNISNRGIQDEMKKRIRTIIETATSYHADALVLGPFGCGNCENNPRIVSELFLDVLETEELGRSFNEIVFAMGCSGNCYEQFFSVLDKPYAPPNSPLRSYSQLSPSSPTKSFTISQSQMSPRREFSNLRYVIVESQQEYD
ncbi:hypothetical protein TRFO_23461 [Tritrichomonas foetus]|uniref:Microbial-type PARG catalytic domain-containing protein n=1 Tax=Tritrichomonas foetus TaxID=1144522 RepID=A0A1J4K9F7_9EUKA|nr:hypothetical protein TRFO_23461 [Tritrichomonas foetus]|eukprot:OHT08105.1 hypothetical protein TRFO_23461 [Tritrichomonas foetus]